MKLAKEILEQKSSNHVGKIYKVLIENKTYDNKYYIGRTYMDIPETDGVIYIKNTKSNLEETFVDCKVTDYKEYDLIGEIV